MITINFFISGRSQLQTKKKSLHIIRCLKNKKCENERTIHPTSWLLLPWQASPPGKVRSDAANPVISTSHTLRTSEIPMPKSVSSAVMHRCHHQPHWHPFTKPVLILKEEISSTFVPGGSVLYTISGSGT